MPCLQHKHAPRRVSIIIPTYNHAHFLPSSLVSALRQRVGDLEIIVVDDGSTDHTRALVSRYANYGHIRYIHQPHQGLPAARNTGIVSSRGEWLLFLDADDILGRDVIAGHLDRARKDPHAHLIVCGTKQFTRTTPDGRPRVNGKWSLFDRHLDVHLCYLNIAPPHAFLVRRSAVRVTGWFDTKLGACEDYDFWLRASVRGFPPLSNPCGLVYYRRHRGSMSANRENQHIHDRILNKRLYRLLDEHPDYPHGRRFEGLLAFAAGAVRTAYYLRRNRLQGTESLLRMARTRIREAIRMELDPARHWNRLTRLFLLRLVYFLSSRALRPLPSATAVSSALRELSARLGVSASRSGLMLNTVGTSMVSRGRFRRETREMIHLGIKSMTPLDLPH